jgi:hypothetical protein
MAEAYSILHCDMKPDLRQELEQLDLQPTAKSCIAQKGRPSGSEVPTKESECQKPIAPRDRIMEKRAE